jgi:hypothetical protein
MGPGGRRGSSSAGTECCSADWRRGRKCSWGRGTADSSGTLRQRRGPGAAETHTDQGDRQGTGEGGPTWGARRGWLRAGGGQREHPLSNEGPSPGRALGPNHVCYSTGCHASGAREGDGEEESLSKMGDKSGMGK